MLNSFSIFPAGVCAFFHPGIKNNNPNQLKNSPINLEDIYIVILLPKIAYVLLSLRIRIYHFNLKFNSPKYS